MKTLRGGGTNIPKTIKIKNNVVTKSNLTATASSVYADDSRFVASKAIDDNWGTAWQSKGNYPEYIDITGAELANVSIIAVAPCIYAAGSATYSIELGYVENGNYTKIAETETVTESIEPWTNGYNAFMNNGWMFTGLDKYKKTTYRIILHGVPSINEIQFY